MDRQKQPLPANWFFESDGHRHGPFTAQEILKFLMEGALKLESKVYDSATDTWKIAADVVPYLDLGSSDAPGWQPPPKPVELKDVHVVDVSTKTPEYFALVPEKRSPRTESSRPSQKSSEPQRPQGAQPQALDQAPRALGSSSAPTQERAPLKVASDVSGILTLEEEKPLLISWLHQTSAFVRRHTSSISIAAGLALIFGGSYGLFRTLSSPEREPAQSAAQTANQKDAAKPSIVKTNAVSGNASTGSFYPSSLGSGQNPVLRRQAGAQANLPRVNPATQPKAQSDSAPQESNREPPQYYSSREEPGGAPQPNQDEGAQQQQNSGALPVPNQAHYDSPNPNNGMVDPPSYITPEQQNAEASIGQQPDPYQTPPTQDSPYNETMTQ
ncbi:MAG: hypothetical protein AB1540_09655 [Bdellovibrionota bacterium]